MLFLSAYIKTLTTLPNAIALMGGLFLLGMFILTFLPETKDTDLPE
jgi:hypothetical protein